MAKPNKRKKPQPTPTQGQERLYGKHSIKAVVLQRPKDVVRILIAGKPEFYDDLIEAAHQRGIDVFTVPWPEFEKVGRFGADDKHQGIMAFVKPRRIYGDGDLGRLKNAKCVLLLDQVSNPQNLATILRSAGFFGAQAVVYMKNRAATPTPEVVRFAVGGAEFIDLYCITNLSKTMDALQDIGFQVLGMDERGTGTLADFDLTQPTAFVIGAEGEGLRPKTRDHCSDLVRIPGGRRGLESLNAAVAATVALYEYARLRG